MKTFFIVDDHAVIKRGISELVERSNKWKCTDTASSFDEAMNKLSILQANGQFPNIITVDLYIEGDKDGFMLVSEIVKQYTNAKCLIYSMNKSSSMITKSLDCGALGFISKSADEKEFLTAFETVAEGRKYIEQSLVPTYLANDNILDALTKREKEILHLTLKNKTNTEIATELNIQKRAVENYISRIYSKTGCKNHSELIKHFL